MGTLTGSDGSLPTFYNPSFSFYWENNGILTPLLLEMVGVPGRRAAPRPARRLCPMSFRAGKCRDLIGGEGLLAPAAPVPAPSGASGARRDVSLAWTWARRARKRRGRGRHRRLRGDGRSPWRCGAALRTRGSWRWQWAASSCWSRSCPTRRCAPCGARCSLGPRPPGPAPRRAGWRPPGTRSSCGRPGAGAAWPWGECLRGVHRGLSGRCGRSPPRATRAEGGRLGSWEVGVRAKQGFPEARGRPLGWSSLPSGREASDVSSQPLGHCCRDSPACLFLVADLRLSRVCVVPSS